MLDHCLAGLSKDIDILLAYQLGNLHIRAVHSSQSHCPVQHELHVASTAGFLGCKGNLLGNVTGRDQLLRLRHIVVLHHHYLQIRTDLRVAVNQFLQTQNQMNDVLGNHIGRRCLGSKNHGNRRRGNFSLLDFQIFVNHIQGIHLLPLILMKPFYLNIKDRIFIHLNSLSLHQIML